MSSKQTGPAVEHRVSWSKSPGQRESQTNIIVETVIQRAFCTFLWQAKKLIFVQSPFQDMSRLWFSPAAVKSRHHLRVCKYKKARSRQLYFLRGHCAWVEKQNKSVACVYCIRGATMLLGPIKPSIMPRHLPATKVGVNAALVAPGSPSQEWGEDGGWGGRKKNGCLSRMGVRVVVERGAAEG